MRFFKTPDQTLSSMRGDKNHTLSTEALKLLIRIATTLACRPGPSLGLRLTTKERLSPFDWSV